jgi:SulP family sulfate permease
MSLAVMVGTLLAAIFLIRKVAESAAGSVHSEHVDLPAPLPPDVAYYKMEGPLFFGSAERAIGAIRTIGQNVKAVIFDLSSVPQADISGFVAVESMLEEMHRLGIKSLFVGARPGLMHFFRKAGLDDSDGQLAWCTDVREAYRRLEIRLPAIRRRAQPVRFHSQQRHRSAHGKAKRQAG